MLHTVGWKHLEYGIEMASILILSGIKVGILNFGIIFYILPELGENSNKVLV